MKSFSERTGKEKAIELLRWLLVPCVGVLIGRVIPRLITDLLWWPIITHIHLSRIGPVSHSKMETSRLLLVSIVLGAAFVVAGAKMAPRARVMTASSWGLSGRSMVLLRRAVGTLGRRPLLRPNLLRDSVGCDWGRVHRLLGEEAASRGQPTG